MHNRTLPETVQSHSFLPERESVMHDANSNYAQQDTYTHIHTHSHTHTHTYACTYTYTYTHIHIHTYTYTYIYTHTHKNTQTKYTYTYISITVFNYRCGNRQRKHACVYVCMYVPIDALEYIRKLRCSLTVTSNQLPSTSIARLPSLLSLRVCVSRKYVCEY